LLFSLGRFDNKTILRVFYTPTSFLTSKIEKHHSVYSFPLRFQKMSYNYYNNNYFFAQKVKR